MSQIIFLEGSSINVKIKSAILLTHLKVLACLIKKYYKKQLHYKIYSALLTFLVSANSLSLRAEIGKNISLFFGIYFLKILQSHYLQLKLLSGKNARTWDSMDFT